jgi:hypothetical protein
MEEGAAPKIDEELDKLMVLRGSVARRLVNAKRSAGSTVARED